MKLIIFLILLFVSLSIYSQVPSWVWAKHGSGYVQPNGITTDVNGNIIIGGTFGPFVTFGNITLTYTTGPYSGNDMFLVKYNSSGNVIWARSFGGSGSDILRGIISDASSNIYIIGSITQGQNYSINLDGHVIHNGCFIAKLDSVGHVIWSKNVPCANNICYSNNYIYLVGDYGNYVGDSLILGNDTLISAGMYDIFIVKLDTSGNFIKAIDIGGNSSEGSCAISNDNNGNIYIIGGSGSTLLNVGNIVVNIGVGGGGILAKFDSSLNTIWAIKNFNDTCIYNDGGNSFLNIDNNGKICVTGYFACDTIRIGNIKVSKPQTNYRNIFIAKYDSSGNVIWAKREGGIREDEPSYNNSLAFDSFNNIYLSGYFSSPQITFGNFTLINPNLPGYIRRQIFLVKYDTSGNVLWATDIGGNGQEGTGYIAIDNSDDIYITGYNMNDTFSIGLDTIKSSGIFLAKMGKNNNTQVKPLQNENFLFIYPNPSDGKFKIKIPIETENISVFNSLGQVIEKCNPKKQKEVVFNIRKEGIYFIQIANRKEIITKKVIVLNNKN
jgi:hypothetical protein